MRTKFKLTERDVEILCFINDFGFCEMPHLDKRFGLKKPRNYQVINRLVKAGFVKHERVFYGRHGIYRLSQKGAKLTNLPPLAHIPLATYTHDITLIDLYLQLREKYPNAYWISERQLKKDKYVDGVGKQGHLPDGILVFSDGNQVAIEIELTLKGKNRLERILSAYGTDLSLREVWYYCPEGIAASISSIAARMPFIKIYHLGDVLSNDG